MSGAQLAGQRIGLLTAWASRLGGGVAEAVSVHAAMIRSLGGEANVFALADDQSEVAAAALSPAPLSLARVRGPRQVGYAPGLVRQLLAADLDLLHLHGIWMYPSRAGTLWARATGRPYVVSPHGMLAAWITGRGRWKKAIARRGYERGSWAAASALHALTAQEAEEIRAESGRDDALVIPNAGPEPLGGPLRVRPPKLLYLGRIHPKKNLAGLLAGWLMARRPAGARLTIAGWGEESAVGELRRLLAAAGEPSVEFVGPAFGEDKQSLLNDARFLILPSFSEGLPMVVLEAWAAATPTLLSEGCNLPEGFTAGAARPCGTAPGEIARAIEEALDLDEPGWLAMAHAASGLAAGRFSAASVASQWEAAYAALLGRGPPR